MSDLISRREAIDAVEKESQVDGAYGYMDTTSIVDLLSDLPSAEPKWIPATERLPEEDKEVLITYKGKGDELYKPYSNIDITTYGQMYFGGNKVGNHKHWRSPFQYFNDNYEVTAWQPLPEPFKGGE